MNNKPSRRKKNSRKSTSSIQKGRLVEKIVSLIHTKPGVEVERNVRLPTLGKSNRKSEIDVLLTSNLIGYPIRIAIECKNEKARIGTPKINSFIGKLEDVGIPTQQGIYVSASGYTSGAIERAEEAGIKSLILKGLTKDRLSELVMEAFQSIIYLLLEIVSIGPKFVRKGVELNSQLYNYVPYLIRQKWLADEIPSLIDEHNTEVEIIIEGEVKAAFYVTYRVLGLVVAFSGQAKQYSLIDAANEQLEKSRLDVSFGTDEATIPVQTIFTEDELAKYLDRPEFFSLTIGRVKAPRIRWGPLYWPTRKRARKKIAHIMEAFEAGEIPDPRPIDITEIEGTDMRTLWEPVWLDDSAP